MGPWFVLKRCRKTANLQSLPRTFTQAANVPVGESPLAASSKKLPTAPAGVIVLVERVRHSPRRSAINESVDEAQPGPGLVDCTHLVVDQAGREDDLPNQALVQVGLDSRAPLGPRDPETAVRVDCA